MIMDFDLLVLETSLAFDIPTDEILSSSRKKEATLARHVVMTLWADDHSFQDTANRCKRGCHSTVIHAREKILNKAGLDHSLAYMMSKISSRCQYGADEINGIEEGEDEPAPIENVKFLQFNA